MTTLEHQFQSHFGLVQGPDLEQSVAPSNQELFFGYNLRHQCHVGKT